MTGVIAFLPMRAGSQRVKNKNTRKFLDYKFGLFELKLSQLLKSNVDTILISTNDNEIINFAIDKDNDRIEIDTRPEWLCTNDAKTDDLIKHASRIVTEGTILWTHVTSPFINHDIYNAAILEYQSQDSKYDSLMSVNQLRTFIWDDNGPINYDRSIMKWPWTQTVSPLYEVNSGIFIADAAIYKTHHDRIGNNPKLFPLSPLNGFDIDWEEDFLLAERLFAAKEH